MPPEGGVFIVHCASLRDYVKNMVRDLLSDHFTGPLRVVVIRGSSDYLLLEGVRTAVEIDHAFYDEARRDVVSKTTAMVDAIKAITGPSGVRLETGSTGGAP